MVLSKLYERKVILKILRGKRRIREKTRGYGGFELIARKTLLTGKSNCDIVTLLKVA